MSYRGAGTSAQISAVAQTQTATETASAVEKVSTDQLTAVSAVTSLAEAVDLPVAGDLREATTTLHIQKQLAQNDSEVISKPQIVQPTTSSDRGVITYAVQEGESLEQIAERFNVSSQTIRWANNLANDGVSVGQTLTVPQTDGIVYTVKEGDTIEGLADRYKVDAERVVLYNDLDPETPLTQGAQIVLPNGELPENERPGYVAPRASTRRSTNTYSYTGSYGNMGGSLISRSYGYPGPTSGNKYAAGNCTWYAYERRAQIGRSINTGGTWGHAKMWARSASAAGFVVNKSPAVGAIIQTSSGGGGYGHVGVVERIEADNIIISDMNYAGYNVVTWRAIPISQAGNFSYIH